MAVVVSIPSYPYEFPFWNSSSVKGGRASPFDVSCSRNCAVDVDVDAEGVPVPCVVADRSLLVCVFGREDGPALPFVVDARVLAMSELGVKALFAKPVAEVWMRDASEGAGVSEGFEVEALDWGLGGLPRLFSWLLIWIGGYSLEVVRRVRDKEGG